MTRGGVTALIRVGTDPDPQRAADPLLYATTDPNLDVRKAAVRALDRLAPDHSGVVAALRSAAEDPDADVGAYARIALRRQTD